mmetsp:Transcript_9727/g.20361  ORF Transcript_9727/g.20361 Transcript_9727/m.20361 type:complete len:298 (-) Transcript_9727:20-913(-)
MNFCLFGDSVDDVEEVCLERGASDQTSIDIGLSQKSYGIGTLHGSSVLDAGGDSNFFADVLFDPFADIGMGFLCHLRCGGEAGSDGPDGFVSNSDTGPVFGGQGLGQRCQLLGADFHGDSGFTFFLLFTDGKHDLEAVVNSNLALLGAKLVGLSGHAEPFTTFGVTDNDPGDTEGLQLVGSNFSGESTVAGVNTTVLGTNGNVLAEIGQQLGDVDVWDAQGNLYVGRDGTGSVEDGDTLGVFVPGSVALPVSTDQVLAGSFGSCFGGRSVGAALLEFGGRNRHFVGFSFDLLQIVQF